MALFTERLTEVEGRALFNTLQDSGMVENLHTIDPKENWWRGSDVVVAVQGELKVGFFRIPLQIGLTEYFPARLPIIAVDPQGCFSAFPHINSDGTVCFRPSDEPLLDPDRPQDIILEATEMAAQTLSLGLKGNNGEEFTREIVTYWMARFPHATICSYLNLQVENKPTHKSKTYRQVAAMSVQGLICPDDRARIIASIRDGKGIFAVADSAERYRAYQDERTLKKLTIGNAVYLPIDPAAQNKDFDPWELGTVSGVHTYILPLLRESKGLGRDIEHRCQARELLIVLGVKRPEGRRALIGLLFKNRHQKAWWQVLKELNIEQMEPVHVEPVDREYLCPRGGAMFDLSHRRVLVVGCGSIGGYIAMNLARMGVGEIHLMDMDSFSPANTFRHVCGRAYLGKRKVEGLKREIERLLPFVAVKALQQNVLHWLDKQFSDAEAYDLIVAAIGNPTVELRLSRAIANLHQAPPMIFAWVEPFGLGGHILVTHTSNGKRGCFNCLYERGSNSGSLECRAAFAKPGARYTREMMGCGSQFIPYGDLDAQSTALYAADRAMEMLGNGVVNTGLASWKGDAKMFRDAGFTTTERYRQCEPITFLAGDDVARADCPICGGI